ncbi:MAG: hypothetical protein OH344_02715 [Candidatus Parvarchaeota archaeon]|nr:hypothetical protein [Candidatus Jingweiarchaeum tengchongense]
MELVRLFKRTKIKMMKKKAAISLSTETIVIIVVALVLFIILLLLVSKGFREIVIKVFNLMRGVPNATVVFP